MKLSLEPGFLLGKSEVLCYKVETVPAMFILCPGSLKAEIHKNNNSAYLLTTEIAGQDGRHFIHMLCTLANSKDAGIISLAPFYRRGN